MSHLGDRITPLVDGQLPPDAAERAHVHVASCRPCREQVEAERLMKTRLASLGDLVPGDALVRRLMDMAGPAGPLPPRPGHVPGTPRPRPVGRPAPAPVSSRPAGRPAGTRRPGARRTPRTRITAAMVGALCLVGAGVAGGSLISADGGGRSVVPPVDTFLLEHGMTAGSLPFGDRLTVGTAESGR